MNKKLKGVEPGNLRFIFSKKDTLKKILGCFRL